MIENYFFLNIDKRDLRQSIPIGKLSKTCEDVKYILQENAYMPY